MLCTDYLDPRLGELDAEHRRTGRPWLLARPFGAQVWIGPVLRPGESACWHCLTNRLWGHRHAEACAQELLGHDGPARRPAAALPPLTAAAAHLVALEASKWLAGYRHHGQQCVWMLDTLDLQGKLHELRRRPQCPGCGDTTLMASAGRPADPARAGPEDRPRPAAGTAPRPRRRRWSATGTWSARSPGSSRRSGATRRRRRSSTPTGPGPTSPAASPGWPGCSAGLRGENGGKGVTPIDAEVGALCEAAERFSGNFQGDELRIRASCDELGDEAVHPNDCMLFAERQYRDRAAWNAAHGPFQHVGRRVRRDGRGRLDAGLVADRAAAGCCRRRYLYYGAPARVRSGGVHADSNGAAAGSSLEDAVLQGTLELVERDAVALWWYNRTPVPGVDLGVLRRRRGSRR